MFTQYIIRRKYTFRYLWQFSMLTISLALTCAHIFLWTHNDLPIVYTFKDNYPSISFNAMASNGVTLQ